MRLTPILIQEGRKEDLRKKYTDKFKEYPETLDFIFGISDLADTNFKYADFVLRELHPNDDTDEIEEVVELVKDFDRFKQSLEVKDINQYDFFGLKGVIDRHKASSKSFIKNIDTSEAKKLYEDKNVLIVKPLTHSASCKYGAGTRWCTTHQDPEYFFKYTEPKQGLYYVILKKFDKTNKFYKIAIHLKSNDITWYDATDQTMSEREIEVFNLGAPKIIQTIKDDYTKYLHNMAVGFFENLFNPAAYEYIDISSAFGDISHKVGIEYLHAGIIRDKPGYAKMDMNISVDEENISQYTVLLNYETGQFIYFKVGFKDNNEIKPEIDFKFDDLVFKFQFGLQRYNLESDEDLKRYFEELCYDITKNLIWHMKKIHSFTRLIHDGNITWTPRRGSYGFTFKRNSGLIKQLVDYFDSGYDNGTKLDFLEYIGLLDKKVINGKPYYSRKGQNDWHISSKWRGQHSGFFNSAKLAGIIEYTKDGNQFIMKPGPNFEAYKAGELKAL
jgi:hypothetical protein